MKITKEFDHKYHTCVSSIASIVLMLLNVQTYAGTLIIKVHLNVSPGYHKHERYFKKTVAHVDISLIFVFAHVSRLKTYHPLTFLMKIICSKWKVHLDVLSTQYSPD